MLTRFGQLHKMLHLVFKSGMMIKLHISGDYMIKAISAFSGLVFLASSALAETPSPEDLLALIDAKVEAENPYRALLNDPDPRRSLAAIEVMLESGDPDLANIAIEFGLLSPNPDVQEIALRGILSSAPALALRMDGTNVENANFTRSILQWLKGSVNAENVGSAPLLIGDYNEEEKCYTRKADGACLFTLTTDGVILKIDQTVTATLALGADGVLSGEGFLYNVDVPVPMSVRLMQ